MERYYNINALTKNDKNRQFTNRYVFISFGKLESLETQKPKNMVILRYMKQLYNALVKILSILLL